MSTQAAPDLSTRERIAVTAARLFSEHGFAGVSMRDIAEAVGVKAASLYNHFDDKESLYFAALAQAFDHPIRLVDQALQAPGTPRQRLTGLVTALVEAVAGDPVSARLLQRELVDGGPGRMERIAQELMRPPFDRIKAVLSELAPALDGGRVAAYLIATVHGYLSLLPLVPMLDSGLTTDPGQFAEDLSGELLAWLAGRQR
ncbi:MAG: TetR family transcriptional regulator [Alphaproteobacteria bacterium]|nr:TetR family transcriptional regulator [Alphaproteobacteria bacterium]